jgi:KipI family sensor histidine kinase inhibitor
MVAEPMGENAWVLRELPGPAFAVAAWIESLGLAKLIEAAPAWETVGIFAEQGFDLRVLLGARYHAPAEGSWREHVIPVTYDGEDLVEASDRLGLPVLELIRLHTEPTYRCVAVGFQPGFPYLDGLLSPLSELPRRSSPRTRVPKGSVAVGAGQAGIYPAAVPGGWWLWGTTQTELRPDESFLIHPGDFVRFEAVG